MNNPKTNYTQQDQQTYLENLFTKLLIERDHPEILKKVKREAEELARKFIEENNVDK
jgi:phosphoribosyl-ATP pyrophosphohydrolase